MTTVVFGGSGQLGSDIIQELNAIAPSHNEVDVRDFKAVYKYLGDVQSDVVINCTAYHDVGGCESNPNLAYLMNCEVPKSMARACNQFGAKFIHFSTDYVFDGKKGSPYYEDDMVAPLNEYGKSKVAGERAIASVTDNYIIGRVSSLFGVKGSSNKGLNFVEKVLRFDGNEMCIVDDIVMSPTYCGHVASVINVILNEDLPSGIYHLNNAGCCSWYKFACKIVELSGKDLNIVPCKSSVVGSYQTPVNSSMSSHKIFLSPWEEALKEYLNA